MRAAGRSVGLPNVRIARGVPVLVCRIATHTIVDHPVIVIVQIDSYPDHVALGGSSDRKLLLLGGNVLHAVPEGSVVAEHPMYTPLVALPLVMK